jgi:hypothetical protein
MGLVLRETQVVDICSQNKVFVWNWRETISLKLEWKSNLQ